MERGARDLESKDVKNNQGGRLQATTMGLVGTDGPGKKEQTVFTLL